MSGTEWFLWDQQTDSCVLLAARQVANMNVRVGCSLHCMVFAADCEESLFNNSKLLHGQREPKWFNKKFEKWKLRSVNPLLLLDAPHPLSAEQEEPWKNDLRIVYYRMRNLISIFNGSDMYKKIQVQMELLRVVMTTIRSFLFYIIWMQYHLFKVTFEISQGQICHGGKDNIKQHFLRCVYNA